MQDTCLDITVDHPLISVNQSSERIFVVRSSGELRTAGNDFEQKNVVCADTSPKSEKRDSRREIDALVLSIIAIVENASMLTEGAICPDSIRPEGIEDEDFAVNPPVSVGELRYVGVQQPFVDADPRHVKKVCTCQSWTKPIDDMIKRSVGTAGDVRAALMLSVGEDIVDQQTCLCDEVWNKNDLQVENPRT